MTSGVLGMSVRGQELERLYVSVSRVAAVSNSQRTLQCPVCVEKKLFLPCIPHLLQFTLWRHRRVVRNIRLLHSI